MKDEMVFKSKYRRIKWVDIAKGIAILLMIIGHEVESAHLYALIFSFHMPLFFILSGYTSSRVNNWTKFRIKLKRSFVRVWLLAAFMVLLYELETTIYAHINFSIFLRNVIHSIFWGSNYASKFASPGVMWFLFVFFWAKILLDVLQVLLSDKSIGIVLIILSGISMYVLSNHWLPQALDIVPVATLFMFSGSMLNQLVKTHSLDRWHIYIGVIVFIFWFGCAAFKIFIEMALRHYPYGFVCILEAICGTLIVCHISQWLASTKLFNFFVICGRHTLALLCIHHLDCYWVFWGGYIHSWPIAVILRLIIDLLILYCWITLVRVLRKVKI